MTKRIPKSVFLLCTMIALLIGIWVLGKWAPDSAESKQDAAIKDAFAKITVPDIQGQTADGKPFHLADYKGKVVLVNFWATWCGPCKMEIPDLIALQNKYGSQGFTIVGLSNDNSVDPVKDFAAKAGLNYPVLLTPAGVGDAFGGVPALPTSFLIDRNGKVVYAIEGVDSTRPTKDVWSEQIDKVI